ncbi:hypothetical protein [Bradyrhizobium retamae]|nr:hypothetical protein [Bradyrhizobium retamae]
MTDEPTQEEIDGVAEVFKSVEHDPIAATSGYIMAKKLKRVFVQVGGLVVPKEIADDARLRSLRENYSVSTAGDRHENCGGIWISKGLWDRCDKCGEERA